MECPFVALFYDMMKEANYDPAHIDWREVAVPTPPPPPPPR
jgi:hypothetical protein